MAVTALLGVAALGGAVVAPTAASAAPSDCPSTYLCAYWLPSYTNASGHGVQKVREDNPDLTMYANFYNAQGGSLYNNGGSCNVTVYGAKNYGAPAYNLNRGTGWTTIGSNLPHIESNKWCTY
ncbi:peptidase inhibitor family I36 protein [Streptomyces nodosus]|nr:peptidase inhibitor family I36 protein [Streptomyces nodosus]MBB4789507.1 hypothetical protein [Streptomyces nodosus]